MFLNQETPWKNELDRNRMAELPRSSVGNWPYQATLAHSNINLRKSLRLVIYNEGVALGYLESPLQGSRQTAPTVFTEFG